MHVCAPVRAFATDAGHSGVNGRAVWAMECALGKHGFEPPDLIVSAGDLIDSGSGVDRATFNSLVLERLHTRIMPCNGNHEILSQDAAHTAGGNDGTLPCNYAFVFGGCAFVIVDTSQGERLDEQVTTPRNEFLQEAFRRLEGFPTFVVTHMPLVPMRDPAILRSSFALDNCIVADPTMLEIVEMNAGSVIAVLCGHVHLTASIAHHGVRHIMASGTASYPGDIASFDVFEHRVEVTMHGLPQELLDRSGDIHGKPRHAIDHTDSLHRNHDSYVRGNLDEREFAIPMPGSRPRHGVSKRVTMVLAGRRRSCDIRS